MLTVIVSYILWQMALSHLTEPVVTGREAAAPVKLVDGKTHMSTTISDK